MAREPPTKSQPHNQQGRDSRNQEPGTPPAGGRWRQRSTAPEGSAGSEAGVTVLGPLGEGATALEPLGGGVTPVGPLAATAELFQNAIVRNRCSNHELGGPLGTVNLSTTCPTLHNDQQLQNGDWFYHNLHPGCLAWRKPGGSRACSPQASLGVRRLGAALKCVVPGVCQ
jgi:hypothetical protein